MRYGARLAMTAALVVGLGGLAALAQPRGGGFGGFGGPVQLVNSKTVQQELKVTDEQATKLKEWGKEYAGKMREMMQEKLKDVPMEERFQKIGEVMAEVNNEAYKELGTVLKPEQVKRLKQIEVQVAGGRAFMMPDVQKALSLTDEQKDKIREAQMASFNEMRELREEYGIKGFGPPKLEGDKQKEYEKKLAGIQKETQTKIEAALTDDQKKKWKELTGDPVDVAKIQADMPRPGGFGKKKKDD